MRLFFLAATIAVGAGAADFARDVQPLLARYCQGCHQGAKPAGGLLLTDAATVQRFAQPILAAVEQGRMPKGTGALAAEQVKLIRDWVRAGAAVEGLETWWAFRPLPAARAGSIDEFIQAGLRAKGLSFSPAADRRTWLRRVTYDLHGLPPAPEEVRAFLADTSERAFEKVVDRLLDSPRYGERWARHWLDVVHYGDSHGYDKDKPRPNAWPYRDWVIGALNADMPYRRFVEQQLAADVLYPEVPAAVPALGFIAAGPWDFVGHQELKEGTSDKNQTRVLDRDDMVAATMSTFVSLTAHCARCHDHKFDPIKQEEYYRLQAVFAGVDRADRPYDEDAGLHRRRQELLAAKRAAQLRLQPYLDKVEFASSAELTALDIRISDGKLLLAHIGEGKTEAERAEKLRLRARVDADTKERQAKLTALVGGAAFTAIDAGRAEVKALDEQLAALPAPKLVYAAWSGFDRVGNFRPALEPRAVHVLNRGSVTAPGAAVEAGALAVVPGLRHEFAAPGDGARRAGLAQWIVAPGNVLTWRSVVNRVWHHHFGAGLVDTPNDFGRMGSRPSHPELLDWLAVWFRDEAGGSLKQLHRAIVLTRAYRQDSRLREDAARVDGENRLLWRMNRTRLDAESVHDSVLAAAGKLDLAMGGPAVQMFGFKNDHSPVYDYAKFDPDAPGGHRRSIYRFLVRSVPDPFFDRLDCPDASLLTPKRGTTLTAIQALALWNNPFMLRMASHLAVRAASVAEMAELAWQRPAAAAELAALEAYAGRHGRENLARLLLNTNEFLYVD